MMDPVDGRGRRRQRSVDGVHTGVDGNARIPGAPRRLRWTMMPIAMMAMSACGAHAAITTHDDGMTYCWSVGASVYTTTVNDATPVQEAKSTDCVMTMSLVLDKATYYATEAIDITWSAKLRRNDSGDLATNSLGMSELYTAVDRISQMTTQIVYSRIESCLANSTSCDPVTGQTDVITAQANQVANFTDSSVSFSADRVSFDKAGSYRVIAHMILPGQNADQQRYDFAIYRAITVTDRPTLMPVTNSPSESQSQQSASVAEGKGLSTEAICLIFVGGMVAVVLAALGFTMLRKNKKEQLPNSVRKGPDNRSRNDATSTDIDDEFAMLSNDERLMQSLRVPDRAAAGSATSGFLSASVPGEQSMMAESRAIAKSKLEGPVPYVGPSRSKDDDHIVDTTTPASMRADGMYVEMKPAVSTTKHSKLQPGKIYFNDIKEDEVLDDGSHIKKASRGVSTLGVDPFKDALSPRASNVNAIRSAGSRLRHMQGDLEEQVPGQPWRQTSELTFDDLRESADVGPGLSLEDLLESHRKVRVSEDVRDV